MLRVEIWALRPVCLLFISRGGRDYQLELVDWYADLLGSVAVADGDGAVF